MNIAKAPNLGERNGDGLPLTPEAFGDIQSLGDMRTQYLQALADQQMPVALGVAGITCAGKSTIADRLIEQGFHQAVKLIPRQARIGEGDSYRPWISNDVAQTLPAVVRNSGVIPLEFDATPSRDIVLGDIAFSGIYAIPLASVAQNLLSGNRTSIILGRAEENYLLYEGLREGMPLAPVAVLQLEVPLKVLRHRATANRGMGGPELLRRLDAMEDFERSDQRQMLALANALPVRTVLNISTAELKVFGYAGDQVQPLTSELLAAVVNEVEQEVKSDAARYAGELLRRREVSYGISSIPDSVVDVLERIVAPAMSNHGVSPLIVGGLGVALYMHTAGLTTRTVSPDIDFVIRTDSPRARTIDRQEERLILAVTEMTGDGCVIRDGGWNPQYLTRQDKAEVQSNSLTGGATVELDCLVAIRLMPGQSQFCFELPLDSHAEFFRREVALPNGSTTFLAPPEQILVDKLLMGRGQELGKFDLFDCAGLLSLGNLDLSLVRRLVDYQFYTPDLDSRMEKTLGEAAPMSFDRICDLLEINDPQVKNAVLWAHGNFRPDSETTPEARLLTIDGLKRLAMISRMCASLDRIVSTGDAQYEIFPGHRTSIAQAYTMDTVVDQATRLKAYLLYYLEFIVDRGDLYTMHPAASHSLEKGFFSALARQTRALIGDEQEAR